MRTGGKGMRALKFIQVGQSLADISFLKFCMLDVGVIDTTDFHGKRLIYFKMAQIVKLAPLQEHVRVGCSG